MTNKRVATSPGAMAGGEEGGGINTFPQRARAFHKAVRELEEKYQVQLIAESGHGPVEIWDESPEGKLIRLTSSMEDIDRGGEYSMRWYDADGRWCHGALP